MKAVCVLTVTECHHFKPQTRERMADTNEVKEEENKKKIEKLSEFDQSQSKKKWNLIEVEKWYLLSHVSKN